MNTLTIACQIPPVVEIDSEARAAYVRFSEGAVARTIPVDTDGVFVGMDLDAQGSVVGIEVVGASEFTVRELLKHAPVVLPAEELLNHARYVSAAAMT